MCSSKFNQANNFFVPNVSTQIKAAAFVGHPDDETIWMGGTLLAKTEWEWTIYVATHQASDSRGKELIAAIEEYKRVSGNQSIAVVFLELMEDTGEPGKIDIHTVENKLDKLLDSNQYEVIFTHNVDGEYGHLNHKILGEYFKTRAEDDDMNVWQFLCPSIQNPREKHIGEYIESIYFNSQMRTKKEQLFNTAYKSQSYLWSDFDDFMNFQFHSGTELFTSYKK